MWLSCRENFVCPLFLWSYLPRKEMTNPMLTTQAFSKQCSWTLPLFDQKCTREQFLRTVWQDVLSLLLNGNCLIVSVVCCSVSVLCSHFSLCRVRCLSHKMLVKVKPAGVTKSSACWTDEPLTVGFREARHSLSASLHILHILLTYPYLI